MSITILAALLVLSIVFGLISIVLNKAYYDALGLVFETISIVLFYSLLIAIVFSLSEICIDDTFWNVAYTILKIVASIVFASLIIRAIMVCYTHLSEDLKSNNKCARQASEYLKNKRH